MSDGLYAEIPVPNPVSISEAVRRAGQRLTSSSTGSELAASLNAEIEKLLTWPYRVDFGLASDSEGTKTAQFNTLIYVGDGAVRPTAPVEIRADSLACVIDVFENIDRDQLRFAHQRIAEAKQLKKAQPPKTGSDIPHTTVTLGVVVARDSVISIESLAEELEQLNSKYSDRAWVDMVAILSKGVINYAVQFPGRKIFGDYLPPAGDATAERVPPMYVIMTVKPTGDFAFNKMCAFVLGHLAIFSPGTSLPNYAAVLEGIPKQVLTMSGYQYNLSGQLLPVPRERYNDRLLPQRPYLIEDTKGRVLANLQYVPWQDGGVIILRGKLPLEGLLVFLGKEVMSRAGKITQPPDTQISYVLPITAEKFRELLTRIQRQSNLKVRSDPTELVVKKFTDEGSRTPFMARIFMGGLRLRDAVFPDPDSRDQFDKAYEFVIMNLLNARIASKEIVAMVHKHIQNVANGSVAHVQGRNINVDENIDKELRKELENFLNLAARVIKHGMQRVTSALQVDIGFLFKKQSTFEKGHADFLKADAPLASYIFEVRKWSELLIERRNAVEHEGWMLPTFTYARTPDGSVHATPPQVSGQPVLNFVQTMLDRICCFVEDVSTHCLQAKMPVGVSITEIPKGERLAEMPERFRLALRHGGTPIWRIAYHQSTFDEI